MDRNSRGIIDIMQQGVCPSCGNERNLYKYLISQDIYSDCSQCGFEIYSESSIERKKNICSYCEDSVFFTEESEDIYFNMGGLDNDNAIKCIECGVYCHTECIKEQYHENCIHFDSDEFAFQCNDCGTSSEYYECEVCGLAHIVDCIITLDSESNEIFGNICSSCFYDDNEEIENAINFIKPDNLSQSLESEKEKKYFKFSMENSDMSILCTHLIRSDNADNAFEILQKILREKMVKASTTGYYNRVSGTKSVCLTELTTKGLLQHSKIYSPFGLGFLKGWIFKIGGGPALYVREDLIKGKTIPDEIKPFINKINLDSFDYHHEREWRVPHDINFDYQEITVIYAPVKYHQLIKDEFKDLNLILDLHVLSLIG